MPPFPLRGAGPALASQGVGMPGMLGGPQPGGKIPRGGEIPMPSGIPGPGMVPPGVVMRMSGMHPPGSVGAMGPAGGMGGPPLSVGGPTGAAGYPPAPQGGGGHA